MKQNVEEEIKSPNPPPPRFAQLRLDLPGVQPAEKMRDWEHTVRSCFTDWKRKEKKTTSVAPLQHIQTLT